MPNDLLKNRNFYIGLFALNLVFLFFPLIRGTLDMAGQEVDRSYNIITFVLGRYRSIRGILLLIPPVLGLLFSLSQADSWNDARRIMLVVSPILEFLALILLATKYFDNNEGWQVRGGFGFWLLVLYNLVILALGVYTFKNRGKVAANETPSSSEKE